MKTNKSVIWFWSFAFATFCCIVSLFAADAPAAATATAGAFATAAFWIDALTPIVTPLLTAGVKKLMPSLPALSIPPIAIVLGVVANALGTVAIGSEVGLSGVVKAVALALAGIGVRELQKNFRSQPAQ